MGRGMPGRGMRCGACGKCKKCVRMKKLADRLNRKLDAEIKAKNEKAGRDGKK